MKTKHARIVIIGTFQERSGRTFWSIIFRLPIQSNPILAWKFCHVLHKVATETVTEDSLRFDRGLILCRDLVQLLNPFVNLHSIVGVEANKNRSFMKLFLLPSMP